MSAPRRKRNSAGGTPALPEREPAAKSGNGRRRGLGKWGGMMKSKCPK